MKKAIIILSGGIDSATCLAMAKSQGYACYALTFDYGQRNYPEIEAAKHVAESLGVSEHRIMTLPINQWGHSALTDSNIDVPRRFDESIPATWVPARNTIFLSIALGWAEALDARAIFYGANIVDGPNYPDCRPEYYDAFNRLSCVANPNGVAGDPIVVHTPVIAMTKQAIIRRGQALGVDYSLTFSCYDPTDAGEACHDCAACAVRDAALEEVECEK